MLTGLMLGGGLGLQLAPVAPAATAATGGYVVAARAARSSKRHFHGEIDLAVEIARLHQAMNVPSSSAVVSTAVQHGAASNAGQLGRPSFDIDELLNWSQTHR